MFERRGGGGMAGKLGKKPAEIDNRYDDGSNALALLANLWK